MIQPFCPVDVRVLDAAAGQAAIRALLNKPARLLVLASASRSRALRLAPFWAALQADGHAVQLVGDIPANPTVADVASLLARLRAQPFEPTAILAVGGGSAIDLGKAVRALYPCVPTPTEPGVREAILAKTYAAPSQLIDLYAMPTTAGTGSEVTRWATVWDPAHRQKRSIDHPLGFPKAAVLVPEWTHDMPPALTLSTGLDALTHAAEAFWAVARTPLSQELALLAVTKVRDALPQVLATPDEPAPRREMCLASLLAGLAFSQTRTTACHSISYPLTMLKGVPHGFAAALTLAPVLRRNRVAVPELARLCDLFGGTDGLAAWLAKVSKGIQPLTLAAFGITAADLPDLCALTFTTGRMDNNPVAFTQTDVLTILREVLA